MSRVTCHMSISLDGFVAGPDQSLDNPLGIGGLQLHQWHFDPVDEADVPARDNLMAPKGAYVMGRNMFGPIRGEWDGDWRGWWGDEPPYHAPVFVLTHYEHDPIEMEGGTTFHFVTGGFDEALRQAKAVAAVVAERALFGLVEPGRVAVGGDGEVAGHLACPCGHANQHGLDPT